MANFNCKLAKCISIAAILITLFLFAANFASAIQNESGNDIYLNIDSLNLKKQNVLIDINDFKTEIGPNNKTIMSAFEYNPQSPYNLDNNGIESLNGVIDFTVKNTSFSWDANKNKLCTRYEFYSIDTGLLDTICYGNEGCCNFINLTPSRPNWDEALYLTYGMHGATQKNIVSSQVIYVDYNLSLENPYSEIYFSRWRGLPAIFNGSISGGEIKTAMINIQRLREKNGQIKKISLKDTLGNEVNETKENEKLSLEFGISKTKNDNSSNDITVSIKNFNASDANWAGSVGLNVSTDNNELKDSLRQGGIDAKTIVSVKGVKDFLAHGYYGSVELPLDGAFDKVIYCPNDKIESCREVSGCQGKYEGIECYEKNESKITVYVPHFSTIVLASDNSSLELNISSPDNLSELPSGENIYLNFTINSTASANYSIDAGQPIDLGNGTSFSAQISGSLSHAVLGNGQHNLTIYIREALGNSYVVNSSFVINDASPPGITLNLTNSSSLSASGSLFFVKISSSEYAAISYQLNGNGFSDQIDLNEKFGTINLTLENGQNNLTIIATDFQGNSIQRQYYFNFTALFAPSCSDATQDGDEIGIDCGGSCLACIPFSVSTDKSSYNQTNNVKISVIARSNSSVNVTVSRQNLVTYVHNFVPVFAGAPIAEDRTIANTTEAGNYTINATLYYLNLTQNIILSFEVVSPSGNPLTVRISPNVTTINEGEEVQFYSTITGNTSTVSYKWDFQNDGSIDSTDASPIYIFRTNGTYAVNLTASDSKWNQTDVEMITAQKLFNLTVFVKDNATSANIDNAFVLVDNEAKNTTSGRADYAKTSGTYGITVTKPGYISFSNNTQINGNAEILVALFQQDSFAPSIQILGPEDNKITTNTSIEFKYKASDSSSVSCTLHANSNSSSFSYESTVQNVASGAESSFFVNNLGNGSYFWNISCTDPYGNFASSNTQSFTIDTEAISNTLSVNLDEQDKNTDDIIAQIDSVSASLDGLSSDEKEAADSLQVTKSLEKAKLAIQRANRDLHSLKWRKLNETGIEEETARILQGIEDVKANTPKSIEVIDKNEFVKYPNKDDMSGLIGVLLNKTNLKFTKTGLSSLVDQNYKLQSLLTITTKAKLLNVGYLSGDKKTITSIQKTVNAGKNEGQLGGYAFYEVFPKDIAKNISEIELLFDYEVVESDPVISIDLSKINDFSYIINKRLKIDDAEKFKSIILNKKLSSDDLSKNSITGLMSFGAISSAFTSSDILKTIDLRLVIELIVITMLVGVFAYYQFGGPGKFELLFDTKTKSKLKEIKYLSEKITNYLAQNKYEEAKLLYKDVDSIFRELPKNAKGKIYGSIIAINSAMDFVYMDNCLKEAQSLLENNQKEKALLLYTTISGLYKNLPYDFRSQIHVKCIELHKKLST